MRRCKAKNRKGGRCRAPALKQADYCFTHDPARAAERKAARAKGGRTPPRRVLRLAEGADLREAGDVRALLAAMVGELVDSPTTADLDIVKKARAVAYVGGVLLRAIELSEVEQKLAVLEAALGINATSRTASVPAAAPTP